LLTEFCLEIFSDFGFVSSAETTAPSFPVATVSEDFEFSLAFLAEDTLEDLVDLAEFALEDFSDIALPSDFAEDTLSIRSFAEFGLEG